MVGIAGRGVARDTVRARRTGGEDARRHARLPPDAAGTTRVGRTPPPAPAAFAACEGVAQNSQPMFIRTPVKFGVSPLSVSIHMLL